MNQNPPPVNSDAITNLPQLSVKSHLDEPPTLEETASDIGAIKKGKAAGPDGIPAEVHKAVGPALTGKLDVPLYAIPSDLRDVLIVTIFKKDDKTNCGNETCSSPA